MIIILKMNIDINLIKKKNFKNYSNKKMNRIINRYERLISGSFILSDCYYNKNNELIINRSPKNNGIEFRWREKDKIKEKLINDINKEKFKMSIHYMKKKLPDEIIYKISTYL